MIAFADGMPLVELEDGRAVAFQKEWIVRALIRAAHKAGFSQWWLAEHVVESVSLSLASYFSENVITVPHLAGRIRDALQAIGYSEIGEHLALGMPGERLDLAALAKEAGAGYELLFFNRLREALRALIGKGTTEFDVVGLAPCVKHLRARKSWSRSCEALQEEIVSFVRTQTAGEAAEREISVQVR